MNWNIKDHGDPIEKLCYSLIEGRIKNYNVFWAKYIGNINGRPASMDNISDELNKKRKLIGQWNYTILRNILSMQRLQKKNANKAIKSPNDLFNQEEDFISSTNLFYNTIELASKVYIHIGGVFDMKKYEAFREFRNSLAHNIKSLIRIDEYYHVPKNFEWFKEQNLSTNDTWIWDEYNFSGLQFQRLSSFLDWCFESSVTLFNQVLKDELDKFSTLIDGRKGIVIQSIPDQLRNKLKKSQGNDLSAASGSSFQISGSSPPEFLAGTPDII